jgi:hypothetical protein
MVTLAEAKMQIEDLKTQVSSVQMSYHELRQVEVSLIRIGFALEKMTGSKELNKVISEFNRVIWTIRMTQIAINAFEAASGPVGWLFLAATTLGLGAMAYDLFDTSRGT